MIIVADENIHQVEYFFSHLGEVRCMPATAITKESLSHSDVLLTRSKTPLNQQLLKGTPIKFIGSTVSGTDHIDFSYLRSTSITLSVARGCNANSVATYCLLSLCELQHKHRLNTSLEKQTIGIVGYGYTAQKLIDKLLILGATVWCYDPLYFTHHHQTLREQHKDYVRIVDKLHALLQCAIISLHPALHGMGAYSTYHLLDEDFIHGLTAEHILINTSRGEVVDEKALLRHIKHVPLSLVIDCWQDEPTINQQLVACADIATPHIAGHSLQAKINGTLHCYHDLLTYLGEAEVQRRNTMGRKIKQEKAPSPHEQRITSVDLRACRSKEEALFMLNRTNYLPSRDQLEAQLSPSQLAEAFNHHRSHYPDRRELCSQQCRWHNTPQQIVSFMERIDEILQ